MNADQVTVRLDCLLRVVVAEHTPAILRNYCLAFNYPGYPLVEPAFANVKEERGAEVHGVACRLSREAMDEMDQYVSSLLNNHETSWPPLCRSTDERPFIPRGWCLWRPTTVAVSTASSTSKSTMSTILSYLLQDT